VGLFLCSCPVYLRGITDNDLSTDLARSSGDFARSALQALPDGKHATFLLHAATALEQLAKALLAAIHPSLIVKAGDFDSLLHVCGDQRAFPGLPRSRVRTITADDAIKRASRFVESLKILKEDLDVLIEVRNGVAHLGESSRADADAVLAPYLKASDDLRAELGLDRAEYWGQFVELVDTALIEHVKEARLRVENALAAARHEFDRRFGELDEAQRTAMLAIIEANYKLDKYDEQWVDCPACKTPAYVGGSIDVEIDEEWDRDGYLEAVHLAGVTFTPSYFKCDACNLALRGREELEFAEVFETISIEDYDERDFRDAMR
jgi:hypothetical protein